LKFDWFGDQSIKNNIIGYMVKFLQRSISSC